MSDFELETASPEDLKARKVFELERALQRLQDGGLTPGDIDFLTEKTEVEIHPHAILYAEAMAIVVTEKSMAQHFQQL